MKNSKMIYIMVRLKPDSLIGQFSKVIWRDIFVIITTIATH